MFKIHIITVGKTKEEWLKAGIDEYTKRLSKTVQLSWTLAKDDRHLESLAKHVNGIVCLDPSGRMMTSEEFSDFFIEQLEANGSRLSLLIGGAEGIPESLKEGHFQVSLSRLTFTHQMTRLILLEQIYRALEIARGSGYHKS